MAPYPSVGPRVDLTLLGSTVAVDKPTIAGTLALYSQTDTTATAAIDAVTLTGAAGVATDANAVVQLSSGITGLGWTSATLGWTTASAGNATLTGAGNAVTGLGAYIATGNIALTDTLGSAGFTTLSVTGPVAGGYGATSGSVSLNVSGDLAVTAPVVAVARFVTGSKQV